MVQDFVDPHSLTLAPKPRPTGYELFALPATSSNNPATLNPTPSVCTITWKKASPWGREGLLEQGP